ncbi:MAG: glucose-6-phosphate isomerase [Planctomycetes bacterium]|nr:glucose-6-phosphate isomerase [Planctomycetota bacterium]
MGIEIDFLGCMQLNIADSGFSQEIIQNAYTNADKNINAVKSMFAEDEISFLNLPISPDGHQLDKIMKFNEQNRGKFDDIVVLGIGGSALASLTFQTALNHPAWNLLPKLSRGGDPRFHLVDNIEPELIGTILDICEPARTLFIVISKSGHTTETIAAFNLMQQFMQAHLKETWKSHFVFITDPQKGWLRAFATEHNLQTFNIPEKVGGRFSALTPVGLLPAALCGIDVEIIIKGAAQAREGCLKAEFPQNWAYSFALIQHLFWTEKQKSTQVFIPYANALISLSAWFKQLWAESLGKKYDTSGKVVHAGQTLTSAIGATDQHSQLQLYIEGPDDKIFTFVEVLGFRRDFTVPKAPAPTSDKIAHIHNHTVAEILQAELLGVKKALTELNKPNLSLILPNLSPETIGELIFGLEFATVLVGHFLGINPLNQPGVELAKQIAQETLRKSQLS